MKTQKRDSVRLTNQLQTSFLEVSDLIKEAQLKSSSYLNKELLSLYWKLGKYLSIKSSEEGWGKNVVKNLSTYLIHSFPKTKGLSAQNLWRMKQFYETYRKDEKLSPLVREISWTNNMIILAQTKSPEERAFYISNCKSEAWSKRELERQIKSSLFERSKIDPSYLGKALIKDHPNSPQLFRDPYMLEFLDLPLVHKEKDLRKGILRNLSSFILEAGRDFSLIGEEYRIQVGMEDFYIDILLFHRGLQCLVAVELKIEHFKPQHLGQLNFYLEALDRNVRKAHENPSVGIILCKSKDKEVVEFSLNRQLSPALVAEYKTQLPEKEHLQNKLHEIFLLANSHAEKDD